MRRRRFLVGTGTLLSVLPGCLGGIDPNRLDGYVRPDEDPASVPEQLACDTDAFQRRDGWLDGEPHWGDLPGEDDDPVFSLRVDTLAVSRGDTVTVTMTNVSGETQQTGNIDKSNLDVYTESGWQDPRGWDDGEPKPITDELREWEPGERVELSFEMTAQGIIDAAYPPHRESLVTCPDLPLGRYRFGTAAPVQGDVAVAFDLRE